MIVGDITLAFQAPEKQNTYRNSQEIRASLELLVCGVWGEIIVNFKKRVSRKHRIVILLHLGLVTCRIHLGKTIKVLIA